MERKKEEFITSDTSHPTMLAKQSFDYILEQVQNSCLNFQMQVSPFSAVVSIKKSFIKDKSGKFHVPPLPRVSSEEIKEIQEKNKKLENDVINLTKRYEDSVIDCEHAYEVIKSFEQKQQKSKNKEEMIKNENEKNVKEEMDNLKQMLHVRDLEIANLKVQNKAAKEASERLNKTLGELRTKSNDEKKTLLKEHRIEIKSWKKNLGQANSNLIKLEKKLQDVESDLASSQSLASVCDSDPVISSTPAPALAVCSSPPSSPARQPPPLASRHSPCTPPGWPSCTSIAKSTRNTEEKIVTENGNKTNEENDVVENNNYEERSAIDNNKNAENIVIEKDAYNERNVKRKCILSTEVQEIIKSEKVDFDKLVEAVRRDKIGCDVSNNGDEDDRYSYYEYDDYPDDYWNNENHDVTDEAIDDQNPDKI